MPKGESQHTHPQERCSQLPPTQGRTHIRNRTKRSYCSQKFLVFTSIVALTTVRTGETTFAGTGINVDVDVAVYADVIVFVNSSTWPLGV